MTCYIGSDGRKWYYFMVDKEGHDQRNAIPLLRDHTLESLNGKLVVCSQMEERLFSVFESHLEFIKFLRKVPSDYRCFYEVIMGEFLQKPHFDVEVSRKDYGDNFDSIDREHLKDEVIKAIIRVLGGKGVKLNLTRDVLLYSSHGPDKISYHIVIDNYCHYNNIEAKQLYTKVLAALPEQYKSQQGRPDILDHAVYSRKQQFRIVGCQKFKSNRPKTFHANWTFQGRPIQYEYVEEPESEQHAHIMLMESSFVSHTASCAILPSFFEPGEASRSIKAKHATISTDLAQAAVKISSSRLGTFPFQCSDIVGGIVTLKRIRPANCCICKRVHEAENAFLLVVDSSVYFYCHRAPNQKLFVGRMDSTPTTIPISVSGTGDGDTRSPGLTDLSFFRPQSQSRVQPLYPPVLDEIYSLVTNPPANSKGMGEAARLATTERALKEKEDENKCSEQTTDAVISRLSKMKGKIRAPTILDMRRNHKTEKLGDPEPTK